MDKNTLIEKINQLRKERNALILAHNYVAAEIQEIADFCGESLELSIKAAAANAQTLVVCGVRFMAETAKILSPDATVIMVRSDAGCPMADMVDPDELKAYKAANPDTLLIAYVNTTAEVKALVDICCTSGNAEKIVAAELAWHLNIGRTTLMTGFKSYTGNTLNDYLIRYRVKNALRMLRQGATTQETADACGFGDICSLIRGFKKCYGMTPKQYRKFLVSIDKY